MSRPVVVSVCGDAGGAEAIGPVVGLLEAERRIDVVAYTYREATSILARHGVSGRELPDLRHDGWARECLSRHRPSAVLVGTSCNGFDWEKCFVSAARILGMWSIAVLDFWSNYTARFSDSSGNLAFLPDLVAVMDERAKSALSDAGVPADRIFVSGQPAFDGLAERRSQFTEHQRLTVRRSFGISRNDDLLVLFASQPIGELYGENGPWGSSLGFDEHAVAARLLDALEHIAAAHDRRVTLVFRPHPREDPRKYSTYHSETVSIEHSAHVEADGRCQAMAADIVVGMNSAFLVEACCLGCVVVSLQPGLGQPDMLPTNASGSSVGVYRAEDVLPVIEAMLVDNVARRRAQARLSRHVPAGGARAIVDRIYSAVSVG